MEFPDFEWPVAPGYELVGSGGGTTLLTGAILSDEQLLPLPGPSRYRRPMRQRHPPLYREFAGCHDRTDIHAFVRRWGLLDTRPTHFVSRYLRLSGKFRGMLLMAFDPAVGGGRGYLPSFTPLLEYFDSGLANSAPILQPIDLYNAMVAQLQADVATELVELRRCRNCGEPLLVGPRNKRRDTEYCGHRCVVAAGRRRARSLAGGEGA